MGQILTMLQPYFASGKLAWKSLTQKYETYNSLYHNSQNTLLCTEVPAGVNSSGSNVPNDTKLYQNYPNPFNPNTVISYSLTASKNVALKIYDVLGNEVASLVNSRQNAGDYSVEFNAGNLASGTYYYSLEAGDYREVKKMVVVK